MLELLFFLIVKHCICDLGLQSQLLWGKTYRKHNYFGCHSHYLHHAIGTLIVSLFFVNPILAVQLAVVDYIAHWHIDFCKHRINNWAGCTRQDKLYWWIAVVDQLLHFLTYYLLVIYLVK